jgi:hypothetical protein
VKQDNLQKLDVRLRILRRTNRRTADAMAEAAKGASPETIRDILNDAETELGFDLIDEFRDDVREGEQAAGLRPSAA